MSSHFNFSKRTSWEMGANRLNDELDRLRSQGRTVIDLTESNPTRCGFEYSPSILKGLSDPANLLYHPESKGMLNARQSICQYYASYGLNVDPESIVLTSSTSEGYTFLFKLLLNPGDKVLIARPSYPLFQYLIELSDAEFDFYPLEFHNDRWQIDLDALENVIDSKTRALIVVNPNNPTGSYVCQDQLEELNRICRRHNLAMISDEVFFDYRLSQTDNYAVSLAGNHEVLSFVLNGISKNLGLPQMKLSWILLNGPQEETREALKRLEIIADTFLSVNTPVQNALPVWLADREHIQHLILERVRNNHALVEIFAQQNNLKFFPSRGGWYAIIHSELFSDEESWVLDLLKQKQVLVHPGYFFDFPEEGFMVLSLLPETAHFEKGLSLIAEYLRRTM